MFPHAQEGTMSLFAKSTPPPDKGRERLETALNLDELTPKERETLKAKLYANPPKTGRRTDR